MLYSFKRSIWLSVKWWSFNDLYLTSVRDIREKEIFCDWNFNKATLLMFYVHFKIFIKHYISIQKMKVCIVFNFTSTHLNTYQNIHVTCTWKKKTRIIFHEQFHMKFTLILCEIHMNVCILYLWYLSLNDLYGLSKYYKYLVLSVHLNS